MRHRRLILTGLFWGSLTVLFLLLSASLGLVAAGYQFDWSSRRLQKTGLLYLAGEPRTATVTINGERVADRLPLRLPTVFPGEYDVVIEKDGYIPWRKTFSIAPGQARAQFSIKLFLREPEVSTVTDPELIQHVKENTDPSPLIVGRELRYNSHLVTRVSGTLLDATLSNDRAHIFFQIDREIRVIELDGTNERLLFTLEAARPAQLIPVEDDRELLLLDGGVVKRLRIR